ncbi:MAG: S1 family peptidase [Rhodoferax sp.]
MHDPAAQTLADEQALMVPQRSSGAGTALLVPAQETERHARWRDRVQAAAAAARARRTPRRIFLRWVLPLALAVLLGMGLQSWRNADLQEQLQSANQSVQGMTQELQSMRQDVASRADLDAVRALLTQGLDGTHARVSAMESGSIAPLVAQIGASVGLVQGRYVLVDQGSGKPLRLQVQGGKVLRQEDGSPRLTIKGNGPVFISTFMGTFFILDNEGTLLTNRHVVLPWEHGLGARAMESFKARPMVVELRGFLPGHPTPFDVMVLGVGKDDLALLRGNGPVLKAPPLRLADANPLPGDTALVFGYPTGVRALLARAGDEFMAQLERMPDMEESRLVDVLAQAGLVKPLVSRGIVGQVTEAAVVYDAQTAGGGSGGPVVNLRGEVLAVNRAVLNNFNGSNMGVPVETVRELLKQVPEEITGRKPSASDTP